MYINIYICIYMLYMPNAWVSVCFGVLVFLDVIYSTICSHLLDRSLILSLLNVGER